MFLYQYSKRQFIIPECFVSCLFCFLSLSSCFGQSKEVSYNRQILESDIQKRTHNFVPVGDKIAALEMIANAAESNFSKIKSWKGKYIFQDTDFFQGDTAEKFKSFAKIPSFPNEFSKRTSGNFEFCTDSIASKYFSRFHVERSLFLAEGIDVNHLNTTASNEIFVSIVTPENYMNFCPNSEYASFSRFSEPEDSFGRAAFIEEKEKAEGLHDSYAPNPLLYFNIGQVSFWAELKGYVDDIRKIDVIRGQSDNIKAIDIPISIDVMKDTIEDAVYKIVLTTRNGESQTERTIYVDGALGYNYVKFFDIYTDSHSSPAVIKVRCIQNYKSINGIYIPSIRSIAFPESFSRLLILEESELNPVLPDDYFSCKTLGLSDGERVVDRIQATQYVYDKGDLIPAQIYRGTVATSNSHFSLRAVFIVVGLLLIGMGVYQKLKSHKRISGGQL